MRIHKIIFETRINEIKLSFAIHDEQQLSNGLVAQA